MHESYGSKKEDDINEIFAYLVIRPISFWVAPLFAILNVTANSVTWLSMLFGILGMVFFLSGGYEAQVLGSICIVIWLILDHVDGNLARYYGSQSSFGDYLDSFVCYFVFAFLPIFIALSTIESKTYFPSEAILIFGWLFSIGFTLPRLLYQKFRPISGDDYKSVLPGSGENRARKLAFIISNNIFNPSGLLVPLLLICALANLLEWYLFFISLGYFLILFLSSAVFLIRAHR